MTVNDRTREQLLGYLLGALEDAERDEVERQFEHHPEWRDELDSLGTAVELLAETYIEHEPPAGLAAQTCRAIEDQQAVPATCAFPTSLSGDAPARSHWSMADVVVLAGICLAAAMLFFPAIAQSRYAARIAACQNQLRQLGMSLVDYSEKAGAGYFPAIPTEGNQSFAGRYGPELMDAGYLTDCQNVVCPSSTMAGEFRNFRMPTLVQIDEASGAALIVMQRQAGGSYAYSLGVVVDGQHRAVRNQGRTHYALMADAPNLRLPDYRSTNHGGRGQNFLYEDGHVQYVVQFWTDATQDHPFVNWLGWTEAGIGINDSVIAPSPSPPFVTHVSHMSPR